MQYLVKVSSEYLETALLSLLFFAAIYSKLNFDPTLQEVGGSNPAQVMCTRYNIM